MTNEKWCELHGDMDDCPFFKRDGAVYLVARVLLRLILFLFLLLLVAVIFDDGDLQRLIEAF